MHIQRYRRQLHDDASSDSSVSSRDISPSVSEAEPIILVLASRDYPPIVTIPVSQTMDPDETDETLYSPASPIVQATGDKEQPTPQDIKGSLDLILETLLSTHSSPGIRSS